MLSKHTSRLLNVLAFRARTISCNTIITSRQLTTSLQRPLLATKIGITSYPSAISFQSQRNISIDTYDTPNPKSLKFVTECSILGDNNSVSSVVISNLKDAEATSPKLGYPLLLVEGVSHVMLGADFVTVTLEEGYDWMVTKPQIFQVLNEFADSGAAPLVDNYASTSSAQFPVDPEDEEAVELIKEIIELRVRPSVMEDGGDIEFIKFDENRIVWLLMKGSCSGCPSSGATLKVGIQNMLMHYVPEVEGVEEWVDEQLESVSAAALAKLEQSLAEAKKGKE